MWLKKKLTKTKLHYQDSFDNLNQTYLFHYPIQDQFHACHELTKVLMDLITSHNIHSLGIYLHEPDQINTLGLMQWALDQNLQVYVYHYEPDHQSFKFYQIHNLCYQTSHQDSYVHLEFEKDKMEYCADPKLDLLLVPVYFAKKKMAYYYALKDYSKITNVQSQYLVGIGYENLLKSNPSWAWLATNPQTKFLICDQILFANDLVKK